MRRQTIKTLARREFFRNFAGVGIYFVSAILLLLSVIIARNSLLGIAHYEVIAIRNPLVDALFVVLGIGGIYIGLAASLSLGREKDSGTLETLFYAPVDGFSLVVGKLVGQLATYLVFSLWVLTFFGIVSRISSLGFDSLLLWIAFISVFVVAVAIAFGLLLAMLLSSTRVTTLVYIGVVGFVLGLEALSVFLANATVTADSGFLMSFSKAVMLARSVFRWLSPVEVCYRAFNQVQQGFSLAVVAYLGQIVMYTVVLVSTVSLVCKKWGFKR